MTKLIDGKQISQDIKLELKEKVSLFKEKYGKDITLAVVLVGENPASQVYVRNKIKATELVGMKSLAFYLDENATEKEVEECVNALAKDDNVDGILVQLPLPKHLDENKILNLIPANKDVDGFLAENVGKLLLFENSTVACTPYGVLELLKRENIEIAGKNAVVIGRSNIVGKPMAMLLLRENATVTICHSKTKDLKKICKQADILVAAIGRAKFVTKDMVKKGAVVIDVGINRVDGKLYGDVDFEKVSKKTSYITPVPGGVGPMTIAMLLQNTYLLALKKAEENV
ncbi:MAG: bifunctional methylenetetrahydrofolate dehydrogenase/methenyltetrahydrofolate cyclohydrolase FolD [Clostridiales bacterium]|nr:bifunctional methylenetetrahydrofolate dehydrogenase/methenyltetrahydrofolate cyclohydrolase FolD [Clostridiales bacterium]